MYYKLLFPEEPLHSEDEEYDPINGTWEKVNGDEPRFSGTYRRLMPSGQDLKPIILTKDSGSSS